VIALVVLTPVSFLMGFPFSMGLRHFAGDDSGRVAWSWAANGYASVVTAPLAALIALELGTGAVFLLAVLGYLIATLLFARTLTGPRACSPSA
jgi:hypothetical protein